MGLLDFFRKKSHRVTDHGGQYDHMTPESRRAFLAEVLEDTLRAEEDGGEAFALCFCLTVFKKHFVSELLRELPQESRHDLPVPNEIEAWAFDLWVVSYAFRVSFKAIPQDDLFALLTTGHLKVYQHLLLLGMAETEVMTLQERIGDRYREYDEAYSGFWAKDERWAFRFGRAFTRNVFGREIPNADVVVALAIMTNAIVIATAQAFANWAPPSKVT